MIICILGPPGSGKTTQVNRLLTGGFFENIVGLSVPKLCKSVADNSDQFLRKAEKEFVKANLNAVEECKDKGKLFPIELDKLLIEVAIRQSSKGKTIMLEGFPRGIEQARLFSQAIFQSDFQCSVELICLKFYQQELNQCKIRQLSRALLMHSDIDETLKRINKINPKTEVYFENTLPGYRYLQSLGFEIHYVDATLDEDAVTTAIIQYCHSDKVKYEPIK